MNSSVVLVLTRDPQKKIYKCPYMPYGFLSADVLIMANVLKILLIKVC